jgi:glyoxylase-like metal-dependent hydrolase (beta-lactamase superfamily II)
MKRLLIVAGGVVAILVLAVGAVLAATFMGRRAASDGQDVGAARIVLDGFSGIGVVPVGEREVLLVDAGQDDSGDAILAELRRRGLGPEAVAAILLTHGHSDHTGAVARFPRAEVMALEREVPVVEGREGTHGPVPRLFPVRPTGVRVARALRDNETVTVGNTEVKVFAVPGHTAGSAAYLVSGVLFVGDSADVTSEGNIVGAPWVFSDSQDENAASLRSLAQRLTAQRLDVRAIVPAHSGAVTGLAPLTAFASGRENR